jgi:ABC-type uncharacterized transport system involved in gliding motility auxiliary subunit
MPIPLLAKSRAYNEALLAGGLVLLLAGGLAALILKDATWWSVALMALGTLVLGVFLAANLAEVKEVGRKRGTVARANLGLVALAMVAILGGLNFIVARHPVRFDLTSNKFFTLSAQTLETLKGLKQDVQVTMVLSSRRSSAEVQKAVALLEEYGKHSTKFKFKTVDADKDPTAATDLGVREPNTVVFEAGKNRKDVQQKDYITYAFTGGRQPQPKFQGEGAFTSALVKMGETAQLTVYFTEGHGERDPNNPQGDGLNQFKDVLEKQNYLVKTHDLLKTGKLPEDVTVLMAAGPQRSFQPAEVQLLKDWLLQGGTLVLALDPRVRTGLDPLLADYGVKLGNDVLVDPVSHNFVNAVEVIPEFQHHAIVEKLSSSRIPVLMPYARSLQKTEAGLKEVGSTFFLQTTDKGWGETDFTSKKGATFQAGVDTKGPVPMGAAFERPVEGSADKKTRMVVFGTSAFLTNQYLTAGGNQDIAANSLSWAAQVESKISILPKEEDVRMVQLSAAGASFVKYLSLLVLPFSVLGLGVWVWYRRRSL